MPATDDARPADSTDAPREATATAGGSATSEGDSTSKATTQRGLTASDNALEMVHAAAKAAADKLAENVVAIDVSGQLIITDVFLVASAPNERQVGAVVDAVEEALHKLGAKRQRREGKEEGRWVLLDYGDLVVHVQHSEERDFYDLERLWKDCPEIDLPEVDEARRGVKAQAGVSADAVSFLNAEG